MSNTPVRHCPAIFVAAASSGVGKTTITSAIARLAVQQGLKVRMFKTGPDYLDPQILSQSCGLPVEQLDIWMAGQQYCQQRLYLAAAEADLIIVEGAMGLYDGNPSSADLAELFNIPLMLIMDVKGMAQTCAALVEGLLNKRPQLACVGMIANRCASQRHRQLIEDSLPATVPLLSTFVSADYLALPERHLGLVQAEEVVEQLEACFTQGAQALIKGGLTIPSLLKNVPFSAGSGTEIDGFPLAGTRIAIAKDRAFSFIYQANIDFLQQLGATIHYFSPLDDSCLPDCDAIWLPGGYPELYAKQLQENQQMLRSIRLRHQQKIPMLAECGGFLYCLEQLSDLQEQSYSLLGLLSGEGHMKGKRGCQGMQSWVWQGEELRGHAHHRSRSECQIEAISFAKRANHPAAGEAIYLQDNLLASYLHFYFASNPTLTIAIFTGQLA